MTFIPALLIYVPKILIGTAIAHVLWNEYGFPNILLKVSIGVLLGFGISSTLFLAATLLGIAPSTYSWIEFFVFLLAGISVCLSTILAQKKQISFVRPPWQDIIGGLIVFLGVLLLMDAFRFYSRMHPYGFEDAWTIWNLTSRFIFREDSPAILLNSQLYNRFHPDYPAELSLNVAWGWFIAGNETIRIPMAVSLLTVFSTTGTAWATLRKWKGPFAAALGGLVIVIASFIPSAIRQDADPLLTSHFLAAAALFYYYLKSKDRHLLFLAGLLAGFSAWVKNEGILFVGVFSMVCLFAAWKHDVEWKALKLLFLGLVLPILIILVYKLVVAWQNDLLGGTNSHLEQILDFSRWVVIGKSLVFYISGYSSWPVSIVIVLTFYAFLMGFEPSETRYQTLLILILIGQLVGYSFIYLITPHDLQLHIRTSMDRLLSHLFPLAILWLFISLRSPTLTATRKLLN